MIKGNDVFYLDLADFEFIFNQVIETKQEFSNDIPPLITRYNGKLESILEQIKAIYFGVELYDTIERKASWLFYSIIKNHPLSNGNKRLALITYFTFLLENTQQLYLDEVTLTTELFEITVLIAESSDEDKEEILNMLEIKTEQYIGSRFKTH